MELQVMRQITNQIAKAIPAALGMMCKQGAGRFASSPPVKIARFMKFRAPRRRSFCRFSFCV